MVHYEVINEGNSNQVFLIGDSHTLAVAIRFKQLYDESVKQNLSKNFPTIVYLMTFLNPYFPCEDNSFYEFSRNLIKKHNPNRILFVYWWETLLQS
jgi:hypothetical protein